MNKRFQVFVSSTFEDLREERQTVMQALLELDCIPAGMELFPAADEEQWGYIQKTIDDCDYYVLIIGGRYGSTGPDGRSFTQMEYEYALSKNKPTIAFLHENPGKLAAERTELREEQRKKLDDFRQLARRRLCKFWSSQQELGAIVSRSISQLKKSRPAVGWIRADLVGDESAAQEIARLRRKIEDLEDQLRLAKNTSGPTMLAYGDEALEIQVTQTTDERESISCGELTWREAIGAVLARALAPSIGRRHETWT